MVVKVNGSRVSVLPVLMAINDNRNSIKSFDFVADPLHGRVGHSRESRDANDTH